MSKASEIRAAFNEGFQVGTVDTVGHDKTRMEMSTALLVAEVANIVRGDDHQCTQSGVALAVGMPHSNGRCFACAVVAFVGDVSLSEYQRVVANIAAVDASAGPGE